MSRKGYILPPSSFQYDFPSSLYSPPPIPVCCVFYIQLTYGGLKWSGEFQAKEKSHERSMFSIQPDKESDSSPPPEHQLLSGETHDLAVHKEVKGTWHLSIFSPYWMVNKTSLTLQYKVS